MSEKTILKTIEYLNSVTGKEYSENFPSTIQLLNNLIELGYNYSDFKKVIDKKWEQWKGTKYQQCVRPTTLFGKNFENYLNEQPTTKPNTIQQLFDAVQRAKQADWRMDKK